MPQLDRGDVQRAMTRITRLRECQEQADALSYAQDALGLHIPDYKDVCRALVIAEGCIVRREPWTAPKLPAAKKKKKAARKKAARKPAKKAAKKTARKKAARRQR